MLGTKLCETLGRSSLVSSPLLAALVIPGPGEALGGLSEVRCSGVDVAGVPGATHGHIGELPATTVIEDVRDFDSRGPSPSGTLSASVSPQTTTPLLKETDGRSRSPVPAPHHRPAR